MSIWATFDSCSPSPFLQGRVVASVSFLKALIKYSSFQEFWFFVGDLYEKQHFYKWHPYFESDKRVKVFLREEIFSKDFSNVVVNSLDINISSLMRWRNIYSRVSFPILGITHSLSYPRFVEEFFKIGLLARDFDCIVCTSNTAFLVIKTIFDSLEKKSLLRNCNVGLSKIPLGIDLEQLVSLSFEDRREVRRQLGLTNKLVFLHFGRLSEYSKADLLALLRVGLRLKSMNCLFKVIIAGATGESDYINVLKNLIRQFKLEDVFSVIGDVSEKDKAVLFSISDCLISLSDNFQETFGLVILEAMAYGLPIICTDWGGYRDLVIDGKTGFLIPSYVLEDMSSYMQRFCYLSYEMPLHLLWAQTIIIDEDKLFEKMLLLCNNRKLIFEMKHIIKSVVENYTWQNIIVKYEKLWQDLLNRSVQADPSIGAVELPEFNVSWFYELYPTCRLDSETLLDFTEWGAKCLANGLLLYDALSPVIRSKNIRAFFDKTSFPITIKDAKKYLSVQELSWLLKHGLVRQVCKN